MLSQSDNELLTRVGPGTPMGELMRRYWIPAVLSSEVAAGGIPHRTRLLGEDLLVLRLTSGLSTTMSPLCPTEGHRSFLDAMKKKEYDAFTMVGNLTLMDCAWICRPSPQNLTSKIRSL